MKSSVIYYSTDARKNEIYLLNISRLPSTFLQEAMASEQCNQDLVALHYWFVSILWLIVGLTMKSVKPLGLLSSNVSHP